MSIADGPVGRTVEVGSLIFTARRLAKVGLCSSMADLLLLYCG